MHLIIWLPCCCMLMVADVAFGYPHPEADVGHQLPSWASTFINNDYAQESDEYVGPSMMGEMHSPLRSPRNPTIGGFVENGIMAGLNFFDSLIPPVYESAVKPVSPYEAEAPKNFTRARRHEDNSTGESMETITTTTPITTTEMLAIVTPSPTTIMMDKMDTMPMARSASSSPVPGAELESMIAQLNKALEYIQTHGNEHVTEEITNATSTEKLVQYISTNIESLVKNKNPSARSAKVKQVSKALDILLNRIAKSAKDLIPAQEQQKNNADPLLLAQIMSHVNEMKQNALSDRLNSGYELTSAELDGGLQAKYRPTRQKDNEKKAKQSEKEQGMNGIDDEDDDDVDDKDVEEIPKGMSTTMMPPEPTTSRMKEVTARQEESSEQQSSSQEGGGNLVANLLSSFLGSLSKPNGAVDVDAIVGLVSGLSVQKDDGTFDFSGVTDLLQSFLGGGEDGGGSDVGAFLGGLLGAVLQGSANPPGPKGTGRLTGNLLANILPGLSGPPPPTSSEEAAGTQPTGKPIDSGSFLAGLLSSLLGASGGMSGMSSGHGHGGGGQNGGSAGFFMKLKQELFKTIFGLITSIIGASAGGSTQASGASSGASGSLSGSLSGHKMAQQKH